MGVRRQLAELIAAYLHHVRDDEPSPLAVETRLEAPLVDPDSGEDLGIRYSGSSISCYQATTVR